MQKQLDMKNGDVEWKILGSEGQVLTSIKIDSESNHFLINLAEGMTEPGSNAPFSNLTYGQIQPLLQFLDYTQQEIATILEVNPSTLSRWKKEDKPIGKLRSKTMFDIDHIMAKGVRVFGTEENFKAWLDMANFALGDKKPIEILKHVYEVPLVNNALEAMIWGNVM